MKGKSEHQLQSGDRLQIAHGAESMMLITHHRESEGPAGAAHLTPAEALSLGTSLYFRGLSMLAEGLGQAVAAAGGPGTQVDVDVSLREVLQLDLDDGQPHDLAGSQEPSGLRRFELHRYVDETGVSGTGVVAQGVVFADGRCALRWLSPTASTACFDGLADVETIHGHGGSTRIVLIDGPVAPARPTTTAGSRP